MFVFLFLVSVLLGAYAYKKPNNALLFFLIWIIVIPTSASTSDINLNTGVYFFDGFFVGMVFLFFISGFQPFKVSNNVIWKLIGALMVFFPYCLISVLNLEYELKYLLKDLRPFILMVEAFLIYALFFNRLCMNELKDQKNNIVKVIMLGAVLSIAKLSLQRFGVIGAGDEFYSENSYRYLDAVTYISSIFVIAYFNLFEVNDVNKRIYKSCLFFCFVCILISGSRFIIIATVLSVFIPNIKNIRKSLGIIALSVVMFFVFMGLSEFFGAERVLDASTYEGVIKQLNSRFSPFMNMVGGFSDLNWILGVGVGEPFEIPWFNYRTDMDIYNANIDTMYLTLFAKFGIFGFFFCYVFATFFVINSSMSKFDLSCIIFLLVMFFVSATFYQIYSFGFIVAVFLMPLIKKSSFNG
jgi:hypothetical protein